MLNVLDETSSCLPQLPKAPPYPTIPYSIRTPIFLGLSCFICYADHRHHDDSRDHFCCAWVEIPLWQMPQKIRTSVHRCSIRNLHHGRAHSPRAVRLQHLVHCAVTCRRFCFHFLEYDSSNLRVPSLFVPTSIFAGRFAGTTQRMHLASRTAWCASTRY